jgi:hypothetical protein
MIVTKEDLLASRKDIPPMTYKTKRAGDDKKVDAWNLVRLDIEEKLIERQTEIDINCWLDKEL